MNQQLTPIVERCNLYTLTESNSPDNQVAGTQVDFYDEENTRLPSGHVTYAKAGKNAVVLGYLYETMDELLPNEVETALIAIVTRHSGLQNVVLLDSVKIQ